VSLSKQPTVEALAALFRFATNYGHGRRWKWALNVCWQAAQYPGVSAGDALLLHGLRNQFGPSWLERVRLERLREASEVPPPINPRLPPINPRLPRNFDNTPNESRPASHQRWWDRPFIQTYTWDDMVNPTSSEEAKANQRRDWFESWPSGVRYDVRCLDGGAWDRPTCWGCFATLEEAIACAATGPAWRRQVMP
jgi:hypothetical protein